MRLITYINRSISVVGYRKFSSMHFNFVLCQLIIINLAYHFSLVPFKSFWIFITLFYVPQVQLCNFHNGRLIFHLYTCSNQLKHLLLFTAPKRFLISSLQISILKVCSFIHFSMYIFATGIFLLWSFLKHQHSVP